MWECVKPFPNKPWFFGVCSTSLLKTLWEKEKLLLTEIAHIEQFLLFQQSFLLFGELLTANSFKFEMFKICPLGKG